MRIGRKGPWASTPEQRAQLDAALREKFPGVKREPAAPVQQELVRGEAAPRQAPRPRAPDTRPLERDVQKAIMEALKLLGWRVIRNNVTLAATASGARVQFGEPGMADLLAVKGGRCVFLEVKRPGEGLRENQVRWHEHMRAYAPVHTVHSVDEALQAVRQAA